MSRALSLSRFERLVAGGDLAEALALSIEMLDAIDAGNGALGRLDLHDIVCDGSDEDYALVFCTRFAAAIGRLLTTPSLPLGPVEYEWLLIHHRWIDVILALSGFRGSDPFIAQMSGDGGRTFYRATLPRLLALLSLHSPRAREIDALWPANPPAVTLAVLHYLGARHAFQSGAAEMRERLLQELPDWLNGQKGSLRLGDLTLARLPEIYMHCSYAFTPAKHAIKAPLIAELRSACLEAGCFEAQADASGASTTPPSTRPTLVVVAEHLRLGHAVYRTHAKALDGLRERFHTIGVFRDGLVDVAGAAVFDECIRMRAGDFLPAVREATQAIAARAPVAVFHIGVGMVAETIALAALRLAPVQFVSYGHTATTMSPVIDYMLLPEDFIRTDGAANALHSEQLVALPRRALPYTPVPIKPHPPLPGDGIVRIAVAASTSKLNPTLFQTLARIEAAARAPVEFHFLTLGAVGLVHAHLARIVRLHLKSGIVHAEAPHGTYMERLARCDFFLSPFPYGNMNSLIDAFQLGLPGICLDGAEPHAHADAAIFRRAGLPDALIARTIDDYAAATLRLIDDAAWREDCCRGLRAADLDKAFFEGDPRLFADALARLIAAGPPALREQAASVMVAPVADP